MSGGPTLYGKGGRGVRMASAEELAKNLLEAAKQADLAAKKMAKDPPGQWTFVEVGPGEPIKFVFTPSDPDGPTGVKGMIDPADNEVESSSLHPPFSTIVEKLALEGPAYAWDTSKPPDTKGTKEKVPVTVQKMDPYEAARQLRQKIKFVSSPAKSMGNVDAMLAELVDAMGTRSASRKKGALEDLIASLAAYKEDVEETMKEIRKLVQNIPTQPNLPTTPDENIVRAIVAILKTNGRV